MTRTAILRALGWLGLLVSGLTVNAQTPAPSGDQVFYCDPAKGSPDGDGSPARPWRTIEEVLAAKRIERRDANGTCANPDAPVQPGATVFLRSGWHGILRVPKGYNDQFITIAAESSHTPQVGWIEIGEGRKWRIKGLTISASLAPAPLGKLPTGHMVALGERGGEQSAELIVEDSFIYSVLDTTGWTAKDWVDKPASGIWLGRHGKGHVARNNYVFNTRFGINLCAPDCVAEGNVVANFSAEKNVVGVNHYHGVSLYDAQGCTIQDNVCFSREPKLRPWVMLGQKSKQARGNTVRNNLAHSFNFKADAEVNAENNLPVTKAVFKERLAELATFIDRKFGPWHPAAKRPRLEARPTQR